MRLILSAFLVVPIALVGAAVAMIAFRGIAWRIAAAVPLLAVAGYFAIVLIPDWARDPTSHNLFPFELGMYFWPAFPYMVVLVAIYGTKRALEKGRSE